MVCSDVVDVDDVVGLSSAPLHCHAPCTAVVGRVRAT